MSLEMSLRKSRLFSEGAAHWFGHRWLDRDRNIAKGLIDAPFGLTWMV
jgi:hypothetical protein